MSVLCPAVTTPLRVTSNQLSELFPKAMPQSRKGKAPAAASDDDDDAATAPLSGREAQWQAGVRRQALPDARQHQSAAGRASGAKRAG